MAEKVILDQRVGVCENVTNSPNGYIMYLEFIKNGEVVKCYYASSCREYVFPNLYYEKVNIYLSGVLPNISYKHSQQQGHVCLTMNQSCYQFVHSIDLSNIKVLHIDVALWLDDYIKHHSKWEGNCIKRPGGMIVDTLTSPRMDYDEFMLDESMELEEFDCSDNGMFKTSSSSSDEFSFYLIKKNAQS